jgi:hypothetical protein
MGKINYEAPFRVHVYYCKDINTTQGQKIFFLRFVQHSTC